MAPERPPVVDRISFARDIFGKLGAPVWINQEPQHGPIDLHEHDFLEVALVVGGRADHLTIHGSRRIGAGDLLIIHPGQWHGYSDTRDLWLFNCCLSGELFSRELSWVHDDPRLAPLFPGPVPRDDRERRAAHQGVRVLRFAGAHLAAVRSAYAALEGLRADGGVRQRRGELVARVLLLFEAIASHGDLTPAVGDPRVAAATALMAADLARPWSLDDLAEHTGTSASHLLRRFRRDTGLAPIAWLARSRAERLAVLLLTTERTVAELGPEVGWDDPSYCARRFRACFGLAPDAYRRRHPSVVVGHSV